MLDSIPHFSRTDELKAACSNHIVYLSNNKHTVYATRRYMKQISFVALMAAF